LDRVLAEPGKLGLANVTTADAVRPGDDAFRAGALHLGGRRHRRIAQLLSPSLTRGRGLAGIRESTARASRGPARPGDHRLDGRARP
jgi:hypothetical protein